MVLMWLLIDSRLILMHCKNNNPFVFCYTGKLKNLLELVLEPNVGRVSKQFENWPGVYVKFSQWTSVDIVSRDIHHDILTNGFNWNEN
jgi:hypothetical protein